ncbi:MAG: peptidase M3, partial [Bacteroidales bacterium]|nr:peptidase M3 [Bacteroidales bacterium]
MRKYLFLLAVVFTMAGCNKSNVFLQEWDTPYGIPPFDKIKIADYMPAIKAGIEQQNAEIQAIIDNQEAPSFENTIAAMDRSGAILEKVSNVLFNVSESDYSPELNAIVEEATPLISAHGDNIMMNPKLFERVKAVYEAPQDNLTREQQMLLKDLYEGFIRNGIGLDEAGQARLREINSELSMLALTFGNNLLAQSNAFKDSVGFSVASYYDKMGAEPDRAQREKIFRLYSNRGNNGDEFDNKATVLRIMELRIEKAKLMGYESPAAF